MTDLQEQKVNSKPDECLAIRQRQRLLLKLLREKKTRGPNQVRASYWGTATLDGNNQARAIHVLIS